VFLAEHVGRECQYSYGTVLKTATNTTLTTSAIDNTPDHNTRDIDQTKNCTTTTVTGSLLHKPVTVAAGNQGSCDKNPRQAVTTVQMKRAPSWKRKRGPKKEGCVDHHGAMAQKVAGVSIRAAAHKI
jgi:hypothetical protein